MAVMKTAQLSYQDHQNGYDLLVIVRLLIFAMNGVEMDLDMKTHGSIIPDETYSDFKKSLATMET